MRYKVYGPFKISMLEGEFKKRIDKEDIDEFWSSVRSVETGLEGACGCYIFSIQTNSKEKPWYVGKAQSQSFAEECFTNHKIIQYHEALEKSKGTPMMYFLARVTDKGRMSSPSKAKNGHAEMDEVERMFITMGYQKNTSIRNVKGTKNAEKLVVEGFYNHHDRRRNPVKRLYDLLGNQ